MLWHTAGSAELAQQVEQHQNASEDRVSCMKIFQTEPVRVQIVFQLGDPALHIGSSLVGAPDRFFRPCQGGYEDAVPILLESLILLPTYGLLCRICFPTATHPRGP